jgi:hypothetical protein
LTDAIEKPDAHPSSPISSLDKGRSGIPVLEDAYLAFTQWVEELRPALHARFRRLVRFFALPYCYFAQIDWEQCNASRWQVASDLLFIFFRLKYYPDNYSLCQLWRVPRSEWPEYYGSIYEPYQRLVLQRRVQPRDYQVLFADKEISQRICEAYGLPVPKLLAVADVGDDAIKVCEAALLQSANGRAVIKPVRGAGGRGVTILTRREDQIVTSSGPDELAVIRSYFNERSIIQEAVTQHESLAAIYPRSLNTMRIETLLTLDGRVLILGSMVRFGRKGSKVDNLSAGGLGVGIVAESGHLRPIGRDFRSREYDRHPDTGVIFQDQAVPKWSETLDLVKRAQHNFAYFRFLGFDVAVTPDGPVIIEINPWPDNVMIEQCSGPILANPEVVLALEAYGALVNQPTRRLARRLRESRNVQ